MNITNEPKEKSQVELKIELTWDEFTPYIEQAVKKIADHVDIPGFRKGQAPREMIEKKVGDMAVLQEAASLAVEKTLPSVMEEHKIDSVGQPSVNIEKLANDNPFLFSVMIPVLPEVTIGDISKIKVEKEEVSVEDAEVDKVVDNLQKMRAKEILAERPAKDGDKTEIKFEVFLDNIPVEGGTADKYPLVIGEGQMIPGFEEQIVGMKKEEVKEFKLKFPDEYHNKMLAGKEADFKVTMIAVFDRELPELNDDFAKEVGQVDTVNALKDEIEKNIFEEKKQKAEQEYERKVVEALIEQVTYGDLPDVMVTQETNQMMAELEQNLAQQGLKFEDYLQHLKKDRGQLMLDFTPDAVKRIKSALAIRTLAKTEKIEATPDEIEEELERYRKIYAVNPQMMEQVNSPGYKQYVTNVLRNKKTLEWLKEKISA